MASSSRHEASIQENEELHSEHMSVLFQRGFKQLLDSGDFVDVTVYVEEERFRLHKSVLCATIPYFQSLFLSNFKESSDDKAAIEGITANGFREVIQFIYTGKLHLTEENIQEVLQAADLLQVDEALMLCDNSLLSYFRKINNAEVCSFSLREIYCLSTMYHRQDLSQTLLHDIKCTAGESPGVYDLPVGAIQDILRDNGSVFWDEDDALYFAKKWLLKPDISGDSRLHLAKEVLSKVRFQLVSKECLEREIHGEDSLKAIKGFDDFIQEMLQEKQLQRGDNFLMLDLNHRQRDCNLHDRALMIVSDVCDYKKSLGVFPSISDIKTVQSKLKVEFCEVEDFENLTTYFKKIQIIDNPPVAKKLLFDLHTETISQYLFCITSHLDAGETTHSVDAVVEVCAFDFLTQIWSKLPPPKLARVNFSVVSHNKCIYIIGGQLADASFTSHVEMYNPKLDAWKTVRPLPKPTAHSKTLSCNGDLYVIGGLTVSGPSRHMFHLRAGTSEWEVFTAPYPFIAHQALFLEPFIIIINADPRCAVECRENHLVAFFNTDTKKWIKSLVRRQTSMALKTDIFTNPVLQMLIFDEEVGISLVFQEKKVIIVLMKVCGTKHNMEVADIPNKFELGRAMEDEKLDHSCHLIAATAVKVYGQESRKIVNM